MLLFAETCKMQNLSKRHAPVPRTHARPPAAEMKTDGSRLLTRMEWSFKWAQLCHRHRRSGASALSWLMSVESQRKIEEERGGDDDSGKGERERDESRRTKRLERSAVALMSGAALKCQPGDAERLITQIIFSYSPRLLRSTLECKWHVHKNTRNSHNDVNVNNCAQHWSYIRMLDAYRTPAGLCSLSAHPLCGPDAFVFASCQLNVRVRATNWSDISAERH